MGNNSIALNAFRYFLREIKGLSEISDAGNKSTIYNYSDRVKKICEREKFDTIDDFSMQIVAIVKKYSESGVESAYGAQSHGSNLKALQLFQEFIVLIS